MVGWIFAVALALLNTLPALYFFETALAKVALLSTLAAGVVAFLLYRRCRERRLAFLAAVFLYPLALLAWNSAAFLPASWQEGWALSLWIANTLCIALSALALTRVALKL